MILGYRKESERGGREGSCRRTVQGGVRKERGNWGCRESVGKISQRARKDI